MVMLHRVWRVWVCVAGVAAMLVGVLVWASVEIRSGGSVVTVTEPKLVAPGDPVSLSAQCENGQGNGPLAWTNTWTFLDNPVTDQCNAHSITATGTAKLDQVGTTHPVGVSCPDHGEGTGAVQIVGVDKIIVSGSNPEDAGPKTITLGLGLDLRAKRLPTPSDGPWPSGKPVWTITTAPSGGESSGLDAPGGDPALARFAPVVVGDYVIQAACGSSTDTFSVHVNAELACRVTGVTEVHAHYQVNENYLRFNVVGPKSSTEDDTITLTITIDPNTPANRALISWSGAATQVPGNTLQATVPIDESTRQDCYVLFNGALCKEITVWPVWATIGNFRGDNATGQPLSPDNNPANGQPPGGLGIVDTFDWPQGGTLTMNHCELRAALTPAGVSGLGLSWVQFDFKRTKRGRLWRRNAGDGQWTLDHDEPLGPDDTDNDDEDLHDENEVVWSVDSPGILTTANVDFMQLEQAFEETVELILNQADNTHDAKTGPLISEPFKWYSIINLTKDAEGAMVRNTARRNEIRPGNLSIGDQPHN